jgi:hypothetical protein
MDGSWSYLVHAYPPERTDGRSTLLIASLPTPRSPFGRRELRLYKMDGWMGGCLFLSVLVSFHIFLPCPVPTGDKQFFILGRFWSGQVRSGQEGCMFLPSFHALCGSNVNHRDAPLAAAAAATAAPTTYL